MDPEVPAQLAKYVGAGLSAKALLGPSVEVVSGRLANATAWTLDNVEHMFSRAVARSHGRTDPVNPRVLARTVDEAGISDTEVMAEYLGGVLASSRSAGGKDDRGVAFVATVSSLSSGTLALHYALYAHAALVLHGHDVNPGQEDKLSALNIFVPLADLWHSVRWSSTGAYTHGLWSLNNAKLFTLGLSGSVELLKTQGVPHAVEVGLKYGLTFAGIELFLWGLGYGQEEAAFFFSLSREQVELEGIDLSGHAVEVSKMPPPPEPEHPSDPTDEPAI